MGIIAWIVLGLAAGLSTWLTAIAGPAVLLVAYRVIDAQADSRMARG